MSKTVNVDFTTRVIEIATDGKEHFISAALAAKNANADAQTAKKAAEDALHIVDNLQITGESTAQAKKNAEAALTSEKNAKASEEAVTTKANDVTNKHDDVVTKHSDVVMKAEQVTTDAVNAQKSADTADGIATQLTEYLKTKESLTAPVVDKTLLIEGAAADSKVVGEKIKESNDVVEAIISKMELIKSRNLFDKSKIISGYYMGTDGVLRLNTIYNVSDYIPVSPDDVVSTNYGMRFVTAFDADKNVILESGVDSAQGAQVYNVPQDISYIRVTLQSQFINNFMLNINQNDTTYSPYVNPYYKATSEFLPEIKLIEDSNILDFLLNINILNPDDITEGYLSFNEVRPSSSYWTTGFLKVTRGKTYHIMTEKGAIGAARFVKFYNAQKINLNTLENISNITIPSDSDVAFMRVTLYASYMDSANAKNVMIAPLDLNKFKYYLNGEFNPEFIPDTEAHKKLNVYVPKEICVGVGRTIELYNNLVCLEADKYHMNWEISHTNVPNAISYGRKWSITGTTSNIGTYNLLCKIYNDDLSLMGSYSSNIIISDNNINRQLNILPIGDSLTNGKLWLQEVEKLSNNKIKYIGTRSSWNQMHEGRSGASANWYLNDNIYTFDHLYTGNPDIDGTKNPFWDGEKFSLKHYIDTQSNVIGVPDAVQLLLGTNGIAIDPTKNVDAIIRIVDAIRGEYPDMPIFVCNTIYRSKQDGYYTTGDDGYAASSDFERSADIKIMNLQKALSNALSDYENLYIIPLSVCMDRDYNFGHKEVAVNPRSEITTYIPNESVHPQKEGYLQIADVIYSSYIAHLK